MKTFFTFVKSWIIPLMGMCALSLLIWFLGPLFSFAQYEPLGPELNRWLVIAALFLIWLTFRFTRLVQARRENSATIASIAVAAEPGLSMDEQASEAELGQLEGRFQEALSALKKTRLGSRHSERQFLHQLPWYILIGPPGSGKTTLLLNSDLRFPLSDQFGESAIRGVGGTRNCDWWFAEEAVLLDTAGRYTTQDSHEAVDRAAWLGFLDLLRKHRRRRPINGAVIAISIDDLAQQDTEQRRHHAQTIRRRLQELHERLGIGFPVYLLFTKCDLMAGFTEFFESLDRERRAQVWGVTFPLNEDANKNAIDDFEEEYSLLEKRLYDQIINTLEKERGQNRRELIYKFPQQFSFLKSLINDFIDGTFRHSRYENPINLRGIYFTSATQEGSPIDRIMGSLARTFGLDRQQLAGFSGQGKSYFIQRLLNEVIFAESGLAGTNLSLEKKRTWIQRGAFVSLMAVTAIAGLVWFTSYMRNKAYIDDLTVAAKRLQENVSTHDADQSSLIELLPLLEQARDLPFGFARQLEKPIHLSMRFGLYQGDKLSTAANEVYQRLLKDVFLPKLMARLEQQIEQNAGDVEPLYESLKTYLMLDNGDHYDRAMLETWITMDWDSNLPLEVSNDQRKSLTQHLAALFLERPAPLPRPLDGDLIRRAREMLARMPLADRVYSRLKLEVAEAEIPKFRVSEKAGRDAPSVLISKSGESLNKGYSGFFTCSGYQKVFLSNNERLTKELVGENWVMGKNNQMLSEEELVYLQEDVVKRYVKDYIDHWEKILDDVQIKAFSKLGQIVELLGIISGDRSPLRLFLNAVNRETSLACLAEKEQSAIDKARANYDTYKSKLKKILGEKAGRSNVDREENLISKIPKHFRFLDELVNSQDGLASLLNTSLESLNELYVYLNSLQHASGEELVLEQRKQASEVISKLKLDAKRNPAPLGAMMATIAESSNNLVLGGVKQHLNSIWKSEVRDFCRKAIEGRYPIRSSASREITVEDFTYFFAPGGLMDGFFNKYLADSVEKGGRDWRWNSRGNSSPGVSSAALKQFQRADAIKDMFFRLDKQTPSFSFSLKPIAMDADIRQINIHIDGQSLTYEHGPVHVTPMKWPGPNRSGSIRVQLLPPSGVSGLTNTGPWALFRAFDQYNIRPTADPENFFLTLNVGGRKAKFELRANSVVNPFHFSDLQKFQCPANL